MTAKIFEFKGKDGIKPHHKTTNAVNSGTKPASALTEQEIFQDVVENVLTDWQAHAAKNRLNEFITFKIPPQFRAADGADYVSDLNAIAAVEKKLDLHLAIFFPGTTPSNTYGWLAAFQRGKETFTTPADMASEATARALNIVLYLSFDFMLKSLGRY